MSKILDLAIQGGGHAKRFISDPGYRAYVRLHGKCSRMPRFAPFETDFMGFRVHVPDSASFLSALEEIFIQNIYSFPFEGDRPRILDVGANIGLSVMYFKQQFPLAKVTAIEADQKIFNYLEKNVYGNGFDDVQLINKAAWDSDTTLFFCSDGADGGHISEEKNSEGQRVQTIDLKRLLSENTFDFLKVDIEGAETVVLPDCRDCLDNLRFIFVEYHSRVDQVQTLDNILSVLKEAGFRVYLQTINDMKQPFHNQVPKTDLDMQINIFGWKEPC